MVFCGWVLAKVCFSVKRAPFPRRAGRRSPDLGEPILSVALKSEPMAFFSTSGGPLQDKGGLGKGGLSWGPFCGASEHQGKGLLALWTHRGAAIPGKSHGGSSVQPPPQIPAFCAALCFGKPRSLAGPAQTLSWKFPFRLS